MHRRLLLRLALGAPTLLLLGPAAAAQNRSAARAAAGVPVPPRKPARREVPLVVIDPGHGGRDPGAIGARGTREKDVVLDVSLHLRRRLSAASGVRVRLTREEDVFLPLAERVRIAQAADADLFVSVHADSAPRAEARGLSAYTLDENASDEFASQLARQENRADRFAGLDARRGGKEVLAILDDLRARHTRDTSIRAKAALVEGAGKTLRLLENPMRSANFAVLRAPDVPSVLVETGFLSNREDEALLRDRRQRRRLADVLAEQLQKVMTSGLFA
jgi:N-acetylmuramoyl-L-alanine amidase